MTSDPSTDRDVSVAPPADHGAGRITLLQRIASLRAWLFLGALLLFFEVWARVVYDSTFLGNTYNLQSIAVFAVARVLLSTGQTFVIISGGIDLSLGFIMGLAAVVAAHAITWANPLVPAPFAVLAGFLAGVLIACVPGAVNGFLVAYLKVPAFIGTLGMFGVARGVAFLLAGGTTVPVSNPVLSALGNGRLFGYIPWTVIIAAVFVLLMHYVLSQTRFGQHNYAIGANPQAARRAGINIRRHLLKLYILSGACAGLAGVLYTAQFSAGAAQAGEPLLLDSVAAVVIGGASLFGGSGTILGTVAGAFVIAVIQYGLVFVDVRPFWQFISVGVVIILSVLIDQVQRSYAGGRQSE
jgi:ribose transport system permease protein